MIFWFWIQKFPVQVFLIRESRLLSASGYAEILASGSEWKKNTKIIRKL
jgi:hypothetical protein